MRLPHHHPDQALSRDFADVAGIHQSAVAQDGHPLRQLEHLGKAVADVDNRHSALVQAADECEEAVRLLLPQRRSRLVEDEQFRVREQRAGDLQKLALGHAEGRNRAIQRERHIQLGQHGLGAPPHLAPGNQPQRPAGPVADEQILQGAQGMKQVRVLRHHRDAEAPGVLGGELGDGLTGDLQGPAIRGDLSGDHLHERRLARAVLADERMQFSGADTQRDVVKGNDAGVLLAQATTFESGGGRADHCARGVRPARGDSLLEGRRRIARLCGE